MYLLSTVLILISFQSTLYPQDTWESKGFMSVPEIDSRLIVHQWLPNYKRSYYLVYNWELDRDLGSYFFNCPMKNHNVSATIRNLKSLWSVIVTSSRPRKPLYTFVPAPALLLGTYKLTLYCTSANTAIEKSNISG